jgi:hypothetical protein
VGEGRAFAHLNADIVTLGCDADLIRSVPVYGYRLEAIRPNSSATFGERYDHAEAPRLPG